MVVNDVTTVELEKLLAIQVRSKDTIRFIPQGLPGNIGPNSNQHNVFSPTMMQAQINVGGKPEVVYQWVRLEWGDNAAKFAREIFDLFVREDEAEAQQAG